jgi:intein/homing endonuclease
MTLEEVLKKLNKGKAQEDQVKKVSDIETLNLQFCSCGSSYLDLYMDNQVVPLGAMTLLTGWEGCLDKDTYIKFINVREDGVVQDSKGGSIENLYNRFHNRNEKTKNSVFNVVSINKEDKIFRNEILNVVKTGKKECIEIVTEKGFKLIATKDHKFYTGDNYKPLSDLSIGDTVYVHNNTSYKKELKNRRKYEETTVKFYYKGLKEVSGYTYYREKVHRLVYEASLNNLSYDEYKDLLNTIDIFPENWNFISEGYDIHHLDENTKNNSLDNLIMICNKEHAKVHAIERHNNLRFIAVEDKIKSLRDVGIKETYDIKCSFPYNNFVANGIVVHNSGKSSIALIMARELQRKTGKTVAILDGEQTITDSHLERFGLDKGKLIVYRDSVLENMLDTAEAFSQSEDICAIVIDSVKAFYSVAVEAKSAEDFHIGIEAKKFGTRFPIINANCARRNIAFIPINQWRENPGAMGSDPKVLPAGQWNKYMPFTHLDFTKKELIRDENKNVIGHKLDVRIKKSKAGAFDKKEVITLKKLMNMLKYFVKKGLEK